MDNWKSLMITARDWECNDAKNLLTLNGIKTVKKPILMNNPDQPNELFGCAKLIVSPGEYERGLHILRKNGYKSDEAIATGRLVEVDIWEKNGTTLLICKYITSDRMTQFFLSFFFITNRKPLPVSQFPVSLYLCIPIKNCKSKIVNQIYGRR